MPYQFDTGETEVIDLLNSSEDEDDVVTPTSHRRSLRHGNESTAPADDSTDSEDSLESSIDDLDKLEADKRTARRRLQHGSTLKLKREIEDLEITAEEIESEVDSDESDVAEAPHSGVRHREAFKHVLESMEAAEDIKLLYPKSLHPDFLYTEAVSDEYEVLLESIPYEVPTEVDGDIFEQLHVHDFSIYRGIVHKKGFNGQLESPHVVSSQRRAGIFHLDCVIQQGEVERRIVGAVIYDVNIGGLYDTATHTSAHHIWIQTEQSRLRNDCWYRLCDPSPEYNNTWNDFVWLADLNKHVLDYLHDGSEKAKKIHLGHFKAAFCDRMLAWHGGDKDFEAWRDQSGRMTDFRSHIAVHAEFLWNQAWSVRYEDDLGYDIIGQPFWVEIGAGQFTEDQQCHSRREKTVVTPNVYSAFTQSFPKWGPGKFNLMSLVPISLKVAEHRNARRLVLGFPDKLGALSAASDVLNVALLMEQAAIANKTISRKGHDFLGQVIVVRPLITQNGPRAQSYENEFRFAFVHQATRSGKAVRVIWLTQASGTICGGDYDRSFYPVPNELFYTDVCNCRPVALSRIVGVNKASVSRDALYDPGSIIVQLLYREGDAAFVNPETAEVLCDCQHPCIDDVDSEPHSATTVPHYELPKIRNMSLFSGCGMLDYGMEESRKFETLFALDTMEVAIRSYCANTTSERCTHVVGSVNPHLRRFLTGETPMPEIDCITAGCPCKGFSLLNKHKKNKKSQRNCSLLASTLSWIELFLPALLLIENVPAIDQVPADVGRGNACAQAICCLVAMGYQVRKIMLSAFEHGSPTLRERLFIVASAPGVPLPDIPDITHGDGTGLHPIVTIGDVVKDLIPVHSDLAINIQDPTHVPIQRLKVKLEWGVSIRNIVQRVPRIPGDGLYQAHQKCLLSRDQNKWYYAQSDEKKEPKSKSLRRVDANQPFKTIVTVISPLDARFGGEIVHPYEDRLLSEKEIRRGQGIPDSFLLIGSLKQRLTQVGNGVAWQVGAALGGVFGKAWKEYHERSDDLDVRQNKSHGTQHILQMPRQMTAHFTETNQTMSAEANTESLRALPVEGVSLQRKLRGMSLEEGDADDLPSGDTIVVKSRASESPSPKLEATSDIEGKADGTPPLQKQKTTMSIPLRKYGDTLKVEDALPSPGRRSPASTRSATEEVVEVSDHESLVVTPGGTYNYSHRQRGKIVRRSTSSKQVQKPVPMVIIPSKKKRSASPTPPPTMTHPKVSEPAAKGESDSEVEYLETRPVTKKPRVTARVEDWYDD